MSPVVCKSLIGGGRVSDHDHVTSIRESDAFNLFANMHLNALHHVELCVANGKKLVSYFTEKLGFSLRATRDTNLSRQWVVGSQKSTFVVTERKQGSPDELPHFTHFCCAKEEQHKIDSVFNVALEVKNVESITARMQKIGAKLFQPVTEVKDHAGTVQYSIVGSCCGNVVHTLLDKSHYKGPFLPTFEQSKAGIVNKEPITHIDHITYVCYPGESVKIIEWYQKCLGMKKFRTNPREDLAEGLVIGDGIGMRLRVMDYWACAETGVYNPNSTGMGESSLKIVIAESLPDQENSHIAAFLRGHQGPGLQHIGLHTAQITDCVRDYMSKDVNFRMPPAAYYRNEDKRKEILAAGYKVDEFQKLGILIDSEADTIANEVDDRFLLQIFTLPLFKEETFFLEVVQRQGARGFGAGNVTALARSIEEERLSLVQKLKASQNMEE